MLAIPVKKSTSENSDFNASASGCGMGARGSRNGTFRWTTPGVGNRYIPRHELLFVPDMLTFPFLMMAMLTRLASSGNCHIILLGRSPVRHGSSAVPEGDRLLKSIEVLDFLAPRSLLDKSSHPPFPKYKPMLLAIPFPWQFLGQKMPLNLRPTLE